MSYDPKTVMIMLDEKEAKLKKELGKLLGSSHRQQTEEQLEEIAAARVRLEEQRYGFCEKCFMIIPWRDLCTLPEKRLCEGCIRRKMYKAAGSGK